MRREARLKEVKLRKNFLPTLIVAILLWLGVVSIVYFVEPDTFGILPVFFFLIFLALLFTFSLLFAHTRRGALLAVGLTLFLILRYLGIGNILNFLLILGIAITVELYFIKK
ncbi:hypothetical protein HYT60_01245 [Candidatus Woesebacteria bacterium]|nr:hypothetical protein [Candidatus Woesebacteria bacterium]